MPGMAKFWLMKSEPSVYSIDDLARDRRTRWTGVRNFQARNFMTDAMKPGDLALFYHSNAEPSGVAGLMRVSAGAAPDETQFDRQDAEAFEPRASRQRPL
jgi:predicted RNA-binding protein with PUA-like domain